MVAAGIFTIAGIIAWQNTRGPTESYDGELGEVGFFILVALVCWVIAALCGTGVIK